MTRKTSNSTDKNRNIFEKIWDRVEEGVENIVEFFSTPFDPRHKPLNKPIGYKKPKEKTYNKSNRDDKTYYDKVNEVNRSETSSRKYITGLQKQKTFNEWLKVQGLSREKKDENYFGRYYIDEAKSLINQANLDKDSAINIANRNARRAGTASHNAYDIASSKFSSNNEHIFDKGLSNSGFEDYLQGIAYLAYRDDLLKTNNVKANAISQAENTFSETKANYLSNQKNSISKRESELYDYYLKDLNLNKQMQKSLLNGNAWGN